MVGGRKRLLGRDSGISSSPFWLFCTSGTAGMNRILVKVKQNLGQVGKKFVPGECHYHSSWPWPTFFMREKKGRKKTTKERRTCDHQRGGLNSS